MKANTNKSNPAATADFFSTLVPKGESKGVLLRPSGLWRRSTPDTGSGERQVGSVMKRDTDQFPVAAWHHSCVATRASERTAAPFSKGATLSPPPPRGRFRGGREAKDRVGARESGRRRPESPRGRGYSARLWKAARWKAARPDNVRPSPGPVVWRHGQRLVWVASRESTTQRGDVRPASRSLLCREATASRGTDRCRVKGN